MNKENSDSKSTPSATAKKATPNQPPKVRTTKSATLRAKKVRESSSIAIKESRKGSKSNINVKTNLSTNLPGVSDSENIPESYIPLVNDPVAFVDDLYREDTFISVEGSSSVLPDTSDFADFGLERLESCGLRGRR